MLRILKLNSTSTTNLSAPVGKSTKPSQRQASDTLREQFGQPTPYTIPSIVSNFNPSAAATELMLAAQLATYNNVLQQQFSNYLNHQSAVDAINSNNMASNSNQSNALPKTNPDESVKKMQKNSLKLSNPFHSPMSSIRDQIISNLTNSMNRKASIERARVIKYAQKRFIASSMASKGGHQPSPNQSMAASARQGQPKIRNETILTTLPQVQAYL